MDFSKNLEYELVRSKIKNMYILIRNGKVIVKVPKAISDNRIRNFINSKEEWINKKLKEFEKKSFKEKSYVSGEVFKVLGNDYTLNIEYGDFEKASVNLNNGYINICVSENCETVKIKELIEKMYYKIALMIVDKSVNMWKNILKIAPDVVVIKKLKTAWGKCNSKGKITINPDLMKYDQRVIDYVVLHEFCHLRYMNHSKDFWNMVSKYMPDYKLLRNELKNVY
ncbi:MAG: M48 family metallopeptidase [Clostridiales bacterium]|nr:M48 family metallopeptidase [Clostridiales bacterium]